MHASVVVLQRVASQSRACQIGGGDVRTVSARRKRALSRESQNYTAIAYSPSFLRTVFVRTSALNRVDHFLVELRQRWGQEGVPIEDIMSSIYRVLLLLAMRGRSGFIG